MRKNARLNELLYDNRVCLLELYGRAKLPVIGFTKQAAKDFFFQFEPVRKKLSLHQFDECFVFSLMTVQNEHSNMKKYDYLVFVEFQDMLTRVAGAVADY